MDILYDDNSKALQEQDRVKSIENLREEEINGEKILGGIGVRLGGDVPGNQGGLGFRASGAPGSGD